MADVKTTDKPDKQGKHEIVRSKGGRFKKD